MKALNHPKARPVTFALVCLLIASSGWAAKLALDHFEAMDDEIIAGLARPSQFYSWAYGKSPARKPVVQAPAAQSSSIIAPATNASMAPP
jgi:hypothetical protein